MQSTHDSPLDTTVAAASSALPPTFIAAFAAERGDRARQGRRFTVAALLTLAVAAMEESMSQIVPPLAAVLADFPDFGDPRGVRHPLHAVLLSCVAMP